MSCHDKILKPPIARRRALPFRLDIWFSLAEYCCKTMRRSVLICIIFLPADDPSSFFFFCLQDVILTSGCAQGLELAITGLADPGDNMLIPKPGFSLYQCIAGSENIEMRQYALQVRFFCSGDIASGVGEICFSSKQKKKKKLLWPKEWSKASRPEQELVRMKVYCGKENC